MPLIAVALRFQVAFIGYTSIEYVPLPSLRINAASVIATLLDLVFLAMAWEYFGKPYLKMQLPPGSSWFWRASVLVTRNISACESH